MTPPVLGALFLAALVASCFLEERVREGSRSVRRASQGGEQVREGSRSGREACQGGEPVREDTNEGLDLGALPPVDFLAVCMVRAILTNFNRGAI